jgi:hypothetical protein
LLAATICQGNHDSQRIQWSTEKRQKDKQYNGQQKKDKQYNGQQKKDKKTNNTMANRKKINTDQQNTTQKTKD